MENRKDQEHELRGNSQGRELFLYIDDNEGLEEKIMGIEDGEKQEEANNEQDE